MIKLDQFYIKKELILAINTEIDCVLTFILDPVLNIPNITIKYDTEFDKNNALKFILKQINSDIKMQVEPIARPSKSIDKTSSKKSYLNTKNKKYQYTNLDELNLGGHITNALRRAKIFTIDELRQKTFDDLIKINHISIVSIEKIKNRLEEYEYGRVSTDESKVNIN